MKNRGKDVCLRAHVYDVQETDTGTRYLDVCAPQVKDDECKFYIVSFQRDEKHVGNLEPLRNADIQISGTVREYHGRAEIVLNDLPQTDIGVAALAAAFPTGETAQVPVILEISGSDLARNAKTSQFNVEIYVYAFDEDGIVRDRMFQRLQLDLAKVGEKILGSGIKYYATLSLPAGRYAIKSLVRVPESEKKGYARVDVFVPPPTEVAVSPPFFFEEPGRWLMTRRNGISSKSAVFNWTISRHFDLILPY